MAFRLALRTSIVLAFALAAPQCPAQVYPAKPIRFLVPYPTGGAPDFLARVIGTRLTEGRRPARQ